MSEGVGTSLRSAGVDDDAFTASRTRAQGYARRIAEILLVGGLTPILFALSFLLREALGLGVAELWTGFTFYYAAHLINDPHFAVTYVLFYRGARKRALDPEIPVSQRVRYVLAGLVVPLALGGFLVWSLAIGSAEQLGWVIQLMFFLVGWHYVKQGFGVMLVLSARRGVRYSSLERNVILLHCYAGWAYAWASPFDPGRELVEKGLWYTTFAHPHWIEEIALTALVVSSIALLAVLARKWIRERRLPTGLGQLVTPLIALLASVWTWTVFMGADPLVRYAVPALHSLQYLYFVGLMRHNEAKEREGAPYFETSARTRLAILALSAVALGFFLFDVAPNILDDFFTPVGGRAWDDPLGATPYFAALYAFVNVHHFVMDAVIWRRDNRETRYLTA